MELEAAKEKRGTDRAVAAGWEEIRIARSNKRGRPDHWYGKRGRSVFVEWKRSKDSKPTRLQLRQHARLRKQGFECYLLWDDDELMDILEGWRGL